MRGTEEDFVGVFLSRAWQPGSVWHLCLPASPAWVGFVPLGSASPLSSPGLCRDKSSLAPRCTFQAVPTAQPGLPPPKWAPAGTRTGRNTPASLCCFFHKQNYPVVFRVTRLGLCSKPCSGSGCTADGRGGRPHNGTELLSWRGTEHHPHSTTWPHSDGRDQARGGVSSAGICPTPAPILELSTAHKCPSL